MIRVVIPVAGVMLVWVTTVATAQEGLTSQVPGFADDDAVSRTGKIPEDDCG
jgi:hypothetical protein